MSANRRIYGTQDMGIALLIAGGLILRREPFKFSTDDSENGLYYDITASDVALESIIFEHRQLFYNAQTARRKAI